METCYELYRIHSKDADAKDVQSQTHGSTCSFKHVLSIGLLLLTMGSWRLYCYKEVYKIGQFEL